MHVMLISQYWEPEQGVVQRRMKWITGDMRAKGHHVSAVVPPPHYPGGQLISDNPLHQAGAVDDTQDNLTVYRCHFAPHNARIVSRVKSQGFVSVTQFFTASKVLRKARKNGHPIDAIVCTVPAIPSAYVAYALAWIHRLPLVVELRDAWPDILAYQDQWNDPTTGSLSTIKFLKRGALHLLLSAGGKALSHVIKHSDLLITTTATLAEQHRAAGVKNVISVRNRANSGVPNCNVVPPRTEGPLRILYAGTVGRAQGLDNVVTAARIAKDRGVELDIRVAGGGVYLKKMRRLAEENDIDIDFLGRIPFDEMYEQYRWADTVLVHLENWEPMRHTIPSKLFEVMWAEKHVTAALDGEAADIVIDSGIGDVVEPRNPEQLADLWEELYNDRSRLDVNGRGQAWFRTGPSLEVLTDRWMDAVEALTQHSDDA